ncbi:hypothetical protein PG994_003775 [Apiospora phragmitis]|uniref:Ankyrin n=1 Tax=Apiospora phragmitis TaxID=2905665 RepID=A0ABR1W2Y1_9PEZI
MLGGTGLDCLRLLIAHYKNTDTRNPGINDETPLMVACRIAKPFAVEVLLAFGADVKVRDNTGSTALLKACLAQDRESIVLLLNSGASVDSENFAGHTPLSVVLSSSALTRLLLDHGAKARFRNLLTMLKYSDLASSQLVYNSLHPKPRNAAEIQRMFRATWESDPVNLGFVLDLDQDKFIIGDDRSVSRMLRYARSNPDSVLLLLERGAKCDDVATPGSGGAIYLSGSTGGQNTCALFEAVRLPDRKQRRAYMRLLLDYGANVNVILVEFSNDNATRVVNKTFFTPFRRAISDLVDREAVEMMLQSKSLQNWNDDLKISYAAKAIRIGSVKLLERLMALGAADVAKRRLVHSGLNYELGRLQQIILNNPRTFTEIDDNIEMLSFLNQNGANWSYRRDKSTSGPTNRELLHYTVSTAGSAYQQVPFKR